MLRKILRLIGFAVLGILGIALVGAVVVYILTERRINQHYDVAVAAVEIPTDAAAIEHGEYLVKAITKCEDCHGEGLGGQVFIDDPALGRLVAKNLTAGAGGIGGTFTDEDWVRAIRHGLGPDEQPLLFMPSQEYTHLGDTDLGDLIAYVKSLPPRDSDLPASSVGPLGRVLLLAGQLPLLPAEMIDHSAQRAEAPEPGVSEEYGEYLALTGGCQGCHGPGLSGGPIPGAPPEWPPARNITPDVETGIGTWTIADFEIALRTGKRPDGTAISEVMPWKATAKMTNDDLQALWMYVHKVPAKPYGGR